MRVELMQALIPDLME